MRKCTKCGRDKELDEFHKAPTGKNGLTGKCKICSYDYHKKHIRTVKGLIYKIYKGQLKSSKTRGHQPPTYSVDELYQWMINQSHFNYLYDIWIESNYSKKNIPSYDRIDNNKSYFLIILL